MTEDEARDRFDRARVAHLATVSAQGRPHLVPITFARAGDATLVSAVDHKPKRTTALARLANIAANPAVAVLVDAYDEDWERLWWARADGNARVVHAAAQPLEHAAAVTALSARYEQYRERPPAGPAVIVTVTRWSGWSASATPLPR